MPSANKKKKKSNNKQSKANSQPNSQPDNTIDPTIEEEQVEKQDSSTPLTNKSTSAQPTTPSAFTHTQSAYERMTVHPISATLPSHLVPPTDVLSQKINALPATSSPFSIYTSTTDTAGRRAIARRPLHPGQLLIRETALPAVIHSEWKGRVCAACYVTVGEGGGGSRVCRACESVVYCSTACLMADGDVHRLECKVLKQLERISDESLVNVDLVRAALAYIVGRRPRRTGDEEDDDDGAVSTAQPQKAAAKPAPTVRTDSFTPEWEDVEGMVDNLSAVTPVDMQHMTAAASLLLSHLPPALHLPIPAVVSFMSRVNNNSHALSASSSASQHVGFGLFPLCSILNHSCYPNTIYTSHLSSLSMRVIREVAAGEELTVNYVGLYGGRWERRRELRDSKKFDCCCRRCVLQPASEEERERFNFDQYVAAIKCTSDKGKGGKRCGGFYRLMSDPSVVATEGDEVWMCNECGQQPLTAELRQLESTQHDRVETALSLYSQQALSASHLLSHFSSLTAELMALFHPHHYLLFNLSLPLINLLHTLQEYRSWRDKIRSVRQLSSHVYPTHYLPSVNYMEAEVQSIDALVRVGQGKLPKKLVAKYREEQVGLQTAIVEAVKMCVGGDSEMARREERRLEEYRSLLARG